MRLRRFYIIRIHLKQRQSRKQCDGAGSCNKMAPGTSELYKKQVFTHITYTRTECCDRRGGLCLLGQMTLMHEASEAIRGVHHYLYGKLKHERRLTAILKHRELKPRRRKQSPWRSISRSPLFIFLHFADKLSIAQCIHSQLTAPTKSIVILFLALFCRTKQITKKAGKRGAGNEFERTRARWRGDVSRGAWLNQGTLVSRPQSEKKSQHWLPTVTWSVRVLLTKNVCMFSVLFCFGFMISFFKFKQE